MILQYLTKVEIEGNKQTIETVRDNVTSVTELVDKIEVTFSTPNGEHDLIIFEKSHHQIVNMWLLNDNFKTLKRLI
mgnify:CR=1 FL=1